MKLLYIVFYLTLLSNLSAERILIGIAGGTASGKTTFAERLQKEFYNEAIVISLDNYFKEFPSLSLEELLNLNWDSPDAVDINLLKEHLLALKMGKSVQQPVPNFETFSRETFTKKIDSAPIIIVEGILLFAIPEIKDMFDIKLYLEVSDDIRLLRRLKRDIQERGGDLSTLTTQYLQSVKPMHDLFIGPSKIYADLIISQNEDFLISFDRIKSILKNLMNQN